MAVEIKIKISYRTSTPAEVRNGTIQPFLSENTLCIVPCVLILPNAVVEINTQVKYKELFIRHLRKKSTDAFRIPDMALVAEHPSLHNPYSVRIGISNRLVHGFSIRSKLVKTLLGTFLRKWKLHFIETVSQIIPAFPELLFPFVYILR